MLTPMDASHELRGSIARRVESRTHGRIRDLQVVVSPPTIVLRGRAPSYYTKQLAFHGALDAALAAESGERIVNEIVVG